MLGNEAVANSPKDGYTLGVMTAGQIIAPVMTKAPRYDTLTAFDSVGQIATAGLLIVTRPDYPAKDIKELIATAKANPGKLNFASPGFGATQHLAAELFKQVAGVNAQQVQFRTSGEALAALLSKNVDVLFDTVTALLGQVQSGQVRALAVTGKDRFPAVPKVPAAIESGAVPGYDVTTWYGAVRAQGHAEAGDRQAQQDAQRDHRRAGGARAPDQGGGGGEGLDAGGLRQIHGRRVRQMDQGARRGRAGAALALPATGRFPRPLAAFCPRVAAGITLL